MIGSNLLQARFYRTPTWVASGLSLLLSAFLLSGVARLSPLLAADPPPVHYRLTWLDNIWGADWSVVPIDINKWGMVVGNASQKRAFLFDGNTMVDLNTLTSVWKELDGTTPVGAWVATDAAGINDASVIVGMATNSISGKTRAFLLDYFVLPHEFKLLPNAATYDSSGAVAINDDGVVVSSVSSLATRKTQAKSETVVQTPWSNYSAMPLGLPNGDTRTTINNLGVIANGTGYVVSPTTNDTFGNYSYTTGVFKYFPNHWFYGINDLNMICGCRTNTSKKPGFVNSPSVLFSNGIEKLLAIDGNGPTDFAGDINDSGDVVFGFAGRGFLDTLEYGTLPLDQLVLSADPEWLNRIIDPRGHNNRGLLGFGQIAGRARSSTGIRGFILTPEKL